MSEVSVREGEFLLEITRFTPTPVSESFSIDSLEDLDGACAAGDEEKTLVMGLACDEGAAGAFFLFLAGERACIHLTEGTCWTASDQLPPRQAQAVSFRMDNGEELRVVPEQTVAREQGFEALRRWYATGERSSQLNWRRL